MSTATMPPGEVIAGIRRAKDWTVYRLAKESGVDPSALARIEAGTQSTSLRAALLLARALGVSMAVFDVCEDAEK